MVDDGAGSHIVMTDCNEAIRPIHDRKPVLLHTDEYDQWLNGSFADLIGFQERCFPDERVEMRRTDEPRIKRRGAVTSEGLARS